ncbi:hypothetical protein CHS0354_035160 [Potamilus streckersoni]|uniref:Uncharacterized protein n=1 Tax=Potamilus streckersoni TaxID=2493646 RepID=A0AAE0TFY8_9BIVA|nr:hypothetical protein CHS0354_035160 [Potamilus streckersoni]
MLRKIKRNLHHGLLSLCYCIFGRIFFGIKHSSMNDCWLSLEGTHQLFSDWHGEQRIHLFKLPIKMFRTIPKETSQGALILGQKVPQKNTLYIQGATDSGKSYWVKSLMPLKELTHYFSNEVVITLFDKN